MHMYLLSNKVTFLGYSEKKKSSTGKFVIFISFLNVSVFQSGLGTH